MYIQYVLPYNLDSTGGICICVPISGSNLLVEGFEHRLRENWNKLRYSKQRKHPSKTSSGNYSMPKSHLLSL